MDLLLFDREDDPRPVRVIPFDAFANRTHHYWHIFVPDLRPGQLYGYRVQGPLRPRERDARTSESRNII